MNCLLASAILPSMLLSRPKQVMAKATVRDRGSDAVRVAVAGRSSRTEIVIPDNIAKGFDNDTN